MPELLFISDNLPHFRILKVNDPFLFGNFCVQIKVARGWKFVSEFDPYDEVERIRYWEKQEDALSYVKAQIRATSEKKEYFDSTFTVVDRIEGFYVESEEVEVL